VDPCMHHGAPRAVSAMHHRFDHINWWAVPVRA
jgi:hypothetical protein